MNTTIINFESIKTRNSHISILSTIGRAIKRLLVSLLAAAWVCLIFLGGIAALVAIGAGILYFTISTIVCLITC